MTRPAECEHCVEHGTNMYRLEKLEADNKELHECLNDIKRGVNDTKVEVRLLKQKFNNLMWPIAVILGAVLVEAGKWLFSLAPAARALAGGP